MNKLGAATL